MTQNVSHETILTTSEKRPPDQRSSIEMHNLAFHSPFMVQRNTNMLASLIEACHNNEHFIVFYIHTKRTKIDTTSLSLYIYIFTHIYIYIHIYEYTRYIQNTRRRPDGGSPARPPAAKYNKIANVMACFICYGIPNLLVGALQT